MCRGFAPASSPRKSALHRALWRRRARDRVARACPPGLADDRRSPAPGRRLARRSRGGGRGDPARAWSGALVVGLTAAKALALALEIPLIAVDHLEGHLYACQLAYPDREVFPCAGLVVSGGHTSLYLCQSPLEYELLGGTTDDAAGEAFDKVASLLGLGYPGGPEIERAAQGGNPAAFAFPRSFLHDERLIWSFSGLKTAVLYASGWTKRTAGPGRTGRRASSATSPRVSRKP